jgi:predicted ferric reductase
MIKRTLQKIFWIAVYVLITLIPLLILLAGPRPAGREFWRDFSVGLAYTGFAMVGLQFVLTARVKVIKAPFGSDIVYFFHHQASKVLFILIALHPLILFIFNPQYLHLLNLIDAPWAARFGVTAIVAMGLLIGLSIWRKKLNIEYDKWRIWHGVFATSAIAFAMIHIELRGYYLNTTWKQIFWAVYGIFWIGLMAWVRVIKPIILLRKAFIVEDVIAERGNAYSLVLRSPSQSTFHFQPGQFAWITIWDSPFSDHEHPFSISSSAEKTDHLTFTIKELGDFTTKIKSVSKGQHVYVDGPFGGFSIDRHPHAKEYVFIAGGVGITPVMSMLRTLADRGDQRPLTLLYANKTLDAATFFEELEEIKNRINLKLVHVPEKPSEGWTGESGYVNAKLLDQYLPEDRTPNRVEIFVCGPGPMMNAVEKALVQVGVPLGDFHSERFDLV